VISCSRYWTGSGDAIAPSRLSAKYDELDRVRQLDDHDVLGPDARGVEDRHEPSGLLVKLAPGPALRRAVQPLRAVAGVEDRQPVGSLGHPGAQ